MRAPPPQETSHGGPSSALKPLPAAFFGLTVVLPGLLAFGLLPPTASAAEDDEPGAAIVVAQAADPDPASPDPSSPDDDFDDASAAGGALAPPSDVEVIRIKGRGVSAIETDVPTSVTQFDASTIEALGAQNISDLAKVTPNVEIRTAGATAATFFIRGVGLSDFSANATGAVAIYQDGVALNAPALQLGQLYDLENVEVLRGPQGGGPARNASAGAIKISSRKPSGEFAAQLRTSFGSYGSTEARDAFIQDYEGALEVPLINEVLSTRLAFRYSDGDPFMKNGCGNQPGLGDRPSFPRFGGGLPAGAKARAASLCGERVAANTDPIVSTLPAGLPTKVGDRNSWAARGQLRFQPPESDMDWLFNIHGSRIDQQSTLGQAIGTAAENFGTIVDPDIRPVFGGRTSSGYIEPDQRAEKEAICNRIGGNYTANNNLCGRQSSDENIAANEILAKNLAEDRPLDINPYRGDYNVVGQTRLDTWGGFLRGDMSFGPVNFTTITGYDGYARSRLTDSDFTPDPLFETDVEDEAWQFTQELALSGELPDEPFRWELGGFYLMEQLDNDNAIRITAPPFAPAIFRETEQDLWSFGIYAGFAWDFLDQFTLEGGVRYNWERKSFDFFQTDGSGVPRASTDVKTWDEPTGTISLNYRPVEDTTVYWKYSRGFKSGTFNSNRPNSVARPEFIDSFETGLRGRYWEGRIGFGAAVFYYKYVDYQVFIFEQDPGSPPVLEIINANDAEVYGAEADFRFEPLSGFVPDVVDGLVITGRFGWLESQFLDFTNTVFRQSNTGLFPVVLDFSGNQLINSPKFKVSGGAEWTFDIGRFGSIIPRYDFAWSDDIFFDPTEGRGAPVANSDNLLPEFAVGQPAFWLHNIRVGYRTPEGNVELAFWCRNIADERYKTFAFDGSTFSNVVINFVGDPRTYGLELQMSW